MELEDIETIAVLGAGTMGHGIAEVAALAGYDVRMRDIDEDLVRDGYDQIEWSLGKLEEKERIDPGEAEAALERIEPLVDLEATVADADFLVEAVPERMDVKREVYRAVEEHAPESMVFTTNTSSLSITELAEVTDRPERFCGMHFFNPPVRMPLVEVIAGRHTAEDTLAVTEALAADLGKTPVRVHRDEPGFIVNRVLIPLMNEAAWMVHEGEAAIESVDSTAKYGLGLPMGVFELADQVGIDVAHHILEYMHDQLGDAYAICPLIEEKVAAETYGKKTGAGFYEYGDGDDGGASIPADAGKDAVQRRLVATMANEVAKLLEADVADVDAIDRALELGGGFPDGPAALADAEGIGALVEELEGRHEETGAARYEPAATLRERADRGGFRPGNESDDSATLSTVRVETRDDGVGTIILDRPERMNSVSAELIEELAVAIDRLESADDVGAILVVGAGDRAFSAGADVQAMPGMDRYEAAQLSRRGQAVFGRLEESPLPVVAGIDGYCLGGGMEIATCADIRIATEESEFGQPEHTLGLLPGWGATQRLGAIVGEGRAKEIILTGEHYDAETMAEYGYVNEVVSAEEFDARIHELAADLAAGPPIAQELTKRAMRVGRDDLEAGLTIESQAFGLVIESADVAEGIAAFTEKREPEFEGE